MSPPYNHLRGTSIMTRSWSNLPPKLLQLISQRLETTDNIRRLRAVCCNWRNTISTPTAIVMHLPLQVPTSIALKLPFNDDHHPSSPLVLVSSSVYLLRPHATATTTTTVPWLIRVEEINKGKIQLKNPLTNDHIVSSHENNNFPSCLDLNNFLTTKLGSGFKLCSLVDGNSVPLSRVDKVVVHATSNGDDCLVVVIYNGGHLGGFRAKEENSWRKIQYKSYNSNQFDDLVIVEGWILALDKQGRLYQIESNTLFGVNVMTIGAIIRWPLPQGLPKKGRQRLVYSPSSKNLYLFMKGGEEHSGFQVYKSKYIANWMLMDWKKVWSIGNDQVVFLTADHGFFASAADFPGLNWGNCIVFSTSCFAPNRKDKVDVDIGVFRLGDANKDLTQSMKDWYSPPTWLCQPLTSLSPASKTGEDDEELQLDFHDKDEPNCSEKESPTSLGLELQVPSSEAIDFWEPETTEQIVFQAASMASITSLTQSPNTGSRTAKFKGLDVRSDLVPLLEKIWLKHGNIVDGSAVRNGDTIARALESLATIVHILEASTGLTLTRAQADYLHSSLLDLQHMQFKVDWIVPFVEKALAVHENKTWIYVLRAIDRARSRATETKTMLLAELAKVEEVEAGLQVDRMFVSSRLSISEREFEHCLGQGLLT